MLDKSNASALTDLILSRRSIMPKRLIEPGPSSGELELMVQASLTAPDHGRLTPCHFTLVPKESRERFAQLLADSKRRMSPSTTQAEVDRAFEKGMNGPVLLAVSARLDRDKPNIPAHEQWIAIGGAVQNFLLAAHALGYGASILSGDKVNDVHLAEALQLPRDRMLIGFITVGTNSGERKPRMDPPASSVLERWSG